MKKKDRQMKKKKLIKKLKCLEIQIEEMSSSLSNYKQLETSLLNKIKHLETRIEACSDGLMKIALTKLDSKQTKTNEVETNLNKK